MYITMSLRDSLDRNRVREVEFGCVTIGCGDIQGYSLERATAGHTCAQFSGYFIV